MIYNTDAVAARRIVTMAQNFADEIEQQQKLIIN